MKAILLKLDSAVHKQWSKAAKAEGMPLSEWIRARVMESSRKKQKNDEDNSASDARRVRATDRARRRASVASGAVHRNTASYVDGKIGRVTLPNTGGNEHDKTCQCRVCQFKREALKKK